MNITPRDLTELIGSRICHDLISPIGAISNGVELISMTGDGGGPEMSLISESVENANAKIRFFRIAFGAASAGQQIGRSDVVSILRDLERGGRLVTEWQPDGDQDRQQVKLAFLLHMCFETAMPWGGHITVTVVGDQWSIYGESVQVKFDDDLWQSLSGANTPDTLQAANVHFQLAALMGQTTASGITVEHSESSIRVRF